MTAEGQGIPCLIGSAEDQDPVSLDSLLSMFFTTAETFGLLSLLAGCIARLSGDGDMFK